MFHKLPNRYIIFLCSRACVIKFCKFTIKYCLHFFLESLYALKDHNLPKCVGGSLEMFVDCLSLNMFLSTFSRIVFDIKHQSDF